MSENADKEYEVSISNLEQEILEAGLLARLLAYPSDYFLFTLMNIEPSCYRDPTARRVYNAITQGITTSLRRPVENPTDDLNISETDVEALAYIRRAVEGGYPCGPFVARCVLELHDRALLRRLAEESDFEKSWQEISQEYADDPDEMPW